jgi:hypothetical protein
MFCNNCGNEAAYAIKTIYGGGQIQEWCDRCGSSRSIANVPDVYFKEAYVDEHLSSAEYPGPKRIGTRAEKAAWLKKCNLREAGDRVHGSSSFDPKYSKTAIENYRRKYPNG